MHYDYLKAADDKTELRLLRIGDVIELTKLSKSYLYLLAAEGRFPRSIPLVPGGKSRAWVYSDVLQWMEQRVAERDLEAGHE